MRSCIALALLLVGLVATSGTVTGGPVSLSMAPLAQTAPVGGIVNLDVRISGLQANGKPSLGLYDLDLGYDGTLLLLMTIDYGDPVHGLQLALNGIDSIQLFGPGFGASVNVYEASLNTGAELDKSQVGNFRLFRASFLAIGRGQNIFTLTIRDLLDGNETNPQPLEVSTVGTATADILAGAVAVPEPGSLALLVVGAAVLALFRQAQSRF